MNTILPKNAHKRLWLSIFIILFSLMGATTTLAQTQALDEIETLIAPIALYPDDLIALILPATTNPIQLVQAERFLEKRKSNPNLTVEEEWDDPIKALLNYPAVIKQLNEDLDWTNELGNGVLTDENVVLDAVQSFRRKTHATGHLKSDDKQTIVLEKELIYIKPTNPELLYIPNYNPNTVNSETEYNWNYLPDPYPVYYYQYPVGSAVIPLLVWGAAINSHWNHNNYSLHYGERNALTTFNQQNEFKVNHFNTNSDKLRNTDRVQTLDKNKKERLNNAQRVNNNQKLRPTQNTAKSKNKTQRVGDASLKKNNKQNSDSVFNRNQESRRDTQLNSQRGARSRQEFNRASSSQSRNQTRQSASSRSIGSRSSQPSTRSRRR